MLTLEQSGILWDSGSRECERGGAGVYTKRTVGVG